MTFPAPATLLIARPNTESQTSAVYTSPPPPPALNSTTSMSYAATSSVATQGMGVVAMRFVPKGTQGGQQAVINAINDTTGPGTTPSFKVWTNVASTNSGTLSAEPMVWLDSSGASSHGRNTLRVTTGNNSSTPLEVGINFMGTYYRRFAVGANGSITRLGEQDYVIHAGTANPQDLMGAGNWGSVFATDRSLQFIRRNTNSGTWPTWNLQPLGFHGHIETKTSSYTIDPRDSVLYGNGASVTFTLPDPTLSGLLGREFKFKNIHATANMTVVSAGTSRTIDGVASVSLAPNDKMTVICNGSQWQIIEGRSKAVTVSATAPANPTAGDVWFDIS